MKTIIISYSYTGNNEALAKSVAKEFAVEHITITEPKKRSMLAIILDTIINRTPQIIPSPDIMKNYDLIIFVGPVWLGKIATPLRAYLNYLKTNPHRYAFVSISGGAGGSNPDLANELLKRTGKDPIALINLYIADLLPPDPKPTQQATMDYRITDIDIRYLTNKIVMSLQKILAQ